MTRLFFVPVNTRPTPPQFSLLSACTGVVIRSRRIPLMRCEYSYRRTARGVRGPGCQNSASTVSQTTIGLNRIRVCRSDEPVATTRLLATVRV